MSFLSRLSSLFALKQKTAVKLIALMSVVAFVANLTPELIRDVPSQADVGSGDVTAAAPPTAPTGKYIFVGEDGAVPGTGTQCTIQTSSAGYNFNATNTCNIAEAAALAASDTTTDTITVVISDAIPIINLGAITNSIHVLRNSTGTVVFDGIKSNGTTKTNMVGNAGRYYMFQLEESNLHVRQNITITNFAFTQLPRIDGSGVSAAIASAGMKTIGHLVITNNYFGTTDGQTLVASNYLAQGVRLELPSSVTGDNINISNNYFYNVISPIQISSDNDQASNTSILPQGACGKAADTEAVLISHNIIGTAKDFSVNTGIAGEGAWSGAAIDICGINNVQIDSNTIANSLGSGFDFDSLLNLNLANANRFDSAIYLKQTQGKVTNNLIGGNILGSTLEWAIFGYGIYIDANYQALDIDRKSGVYINNNVINNIWSPSSNTFTTTCSAARYTLASQGRACGGTAIVLDSTAQNLIAYNYIGNPVFNNWGYGIEIKGDFRDIGSTTDFPMPSYNNVILKNFIYYNKADGIMVDTIDRPNSSPVGSACTSVGLGGGDFNDNNCWNSILQNVILRNGNYNETSFGSVSPSPEGGIGIDLKATTDISEQKYGLVQYTGSGTTNDTDISVNDSNDADVGGNGVLNSPVIHGSGATEQPSTFQTIHGDLGANTNGTYWVEVYKVNCPAEFLSTSPVITAANAANNCDTDSAPGGDPEDPERPTYGQGSTFLCGAFVEKTDTTGSDQWACSPSEFHTSFSGGMLTSTVTEISTPTTRTNYSPDAILPPAGTLISGYTTSPILLSCALINSFFTGTSSVCPDTEPNSIGVDVGEIRSIVILATGAKSTSEFSANIFIAPGLIDTTKTVRNCTTSSSCNGETFTDNVSRTPEQYVEFKVEIINNTGTFINPNFSDDLPAGLEWVNGSCQVFSGINNSQNLSTGARPSLSLDTGRPCTISGQNITFSNGSPQISNGQKRVVYAIAKISSTTTPAIYTNTATLINGDLGCLTSEPCTPSASVTVAAGATSDLVKTIQPGDLHAKTLTGPTTNSTVNYQIRTALTGITKENIDSLNITDNFPHTVRTGSLATYSDCKFTLQVNGGPMGPQHNCANSSLINTTDLTDLVIWNGQLDYLPNPADVVTITITYQSTVPPLLSSDTANTVLTNTAKFNGTGFTTREDSTVLTITPPTAEVVVPPSLHKQVRACTGTTADTCTGAFNETGISSVAPGSTVEYRLEATSSTGSTFSFKDPAPTGITFVTSANSCLVYSGLTQLNTSAARPTTGGSPCTFDSTSGTQVLNTSAQTITANQYAYVYALATVASTATGTITNTASLTGNGCTTVLAQCSDSATVTIAVATPGQVTIDKQVNPTAVTSSTTATQDVTYTIVLSKPNTFAINNATWTDTFPTTPVALSNYTCTSVTVLPAGAQTIACPTTFPPAGGTLFSGTINTAVTSITMTYTARVPVNAVTTTAQSVTNSTTIAGTRSTDSVALSQTDTAVLTVNPNTTSNGGNTGVPVVSLTKRADNNVTSSNRALEKIYKPGDTVNYTLSLLNSGSAAATGITLQDIFHSMLKSMTIDTLPTGATQSLTSTLFNFASINVPTGTTPTTVTYHGTIADKSSFDLDLFDLKENSNPSRDDDFYAPKDADIEDDIGTSNNSHRRAEDILGAPDGRFVSLGTDGEMTINLGSKVIVNGSGDDFALRTINQSVDDTDQSGEDLKVSVSQDGTTFKTINPRSTDEYRYDLSKAKMSWIRYIRLTDESSSVKARAPGMDIDAICLLNIGVQLPNRVNMTVGSQSAFATEYVTVDVTKVFSKKPSIDNCTEPDPTPVIQQELPPPPPAPLPPAPVYVPAPTPPSLPKTGAEPLVLISVVSSLAWVFTTRKKK